MNSEKYSKNFLNEVIFQIRFAPLLELYTDKKNAATNFQNIISEKFPNLDFESNRKVKIKFDNTEKPVETITDDEYITWIFSNNLGNYVRLNGKELILGYSGENYSSFEEFFNDIDLILNALKQYTVPQIKSIGLRYINQITIGNESIKNPYITPNLLFINEIFDKNELIQSINKTELRIQEYNLTFQFGQFNPEYPNISSKKDFILDYDCVLVDNESFENIYLNLKKCMI